MVFLNRISSLALNNRILVNAMDQQIETPNDNDMDKIAKLLTISGVLADTIIGEPFDGSVNDLERMQQILDSNLVDAERTLELQSLGVALGQVLANSDRDYDWWMVSDEQGRDPCLRYKDSNLLVFPQTFLSKRVEQGEAVNVASLYHGLVEQLDAVIDQQLDR